MTAGDVPGLFDAIALPEVFAGGYGGGPDGLPRDPAAFGRFAAGYYNTGTNQSFTIRLVGGDAAGLIVGTSTLGDFDEPNEHTHIGWTAYSPAVWGTAVNAEAKLLLLGLAFGSGFGRVKIVADGRNERSRAAIAGIGATFEGLIRRDKKRADGSWRSTAQFSVIIDDWPHVRAGLESRLSRYDSPVVPRPS